MLNDLSLHLSQTYVTALPLCDLLQKITQLPWKLDENFTSVWACSRYSYKLPLISANIPSCSSSTFLNKLKKEIFFTPLILPELPYFDALFSQLGIELATFIFISHDFYLPFSQRCILQISGIPSHLPYPSNLKKRLEPYLSTIPHGPSFSNCNLFLLLRKPKLSKYLFAERHSLSKQLPILNFPKKGFENELLQHEFDCDSGYDPVNSVNIFFDNQLKELDFLVPRNSCFYKLRTRFCNPNAFQSMFTSQTDLLSHVFFNSHSHNLLKHYDLCEWMQKQLQLLVCNHMKINFLHLFSHTCRIASRFKSGRRFSFQSAINRWTTHMQVQQFIRRILQLVVPTKLLGSKRNINAFNGSLKRLVSSRIGGSLRYVHFYQNLQSSDISWLRYISNGKLRRVLFSYLIKFLVDYFCKALRCFFFITQSAVHRQMAVFYRKDLWSRIYAWQLRMYRMTKFIEPVRHFKPQYHFYRARFLLGSGKLRHINSVKFLGNSRGPLAMYQSILSRLANQTPFVGNSRTDFQDSLRQYLTLPLLHNRKLLFVRSDVSDCFHSINQRKLLDILRQSLAEHGVNSCHVMHVYQTPSNDLDGGRFRHLPLLTSLSRSLDSLSRLQDKLLILCHQPVRRLSAENIILFVKRQLIDSLLTDGRRLFFQRKGLVQGSCLSNVLCRIYMGALLRTHFNDLANHPEDFLFAYADDLLLLSPSPQRAQNYARRLLKGFDDFSLRTNNSKFQANFEIFHKSHYNYESKEGASKNHLNCSLNICTNSQTYNILKNKSGICLFKEFTFMGLTIQPNKRQFRRDLGPLKEGLTQFSLHVDECIELRNFWHKYTRVNLHVHMLDQRLLSLSNILENTFERMAFAAARLLCYLQIRPTETYGKQAEQPELVLRFAAACAWSLYVQIACVRDQRKAQCDLKLVDVMWISANAFALVWNKAGLRITEKKALQSVTLQLMPLIRKQIKRVRPGERLKQTLHWSRLPKFK